MCKAHAGIRRSLKLDYSLRHSLDKRSTLLRDQPVEQVPRDPPFKPSLCHVLGVCVCSENQKALWCHENLARVFRHVLWKKRKSEERSLTRQLVEDGMLCLEIRPPNMQVESEDLDSALSTLHHGDGWDDCFQDEKKIIECIESRKPLFFFIGQINLRNMHFTVLQLQQTTPLQAEFPDDDETLNQVCYLQPLAATQNTDDMQKHIFTDMEIFTRLLDLEKPWSLRFHGFSGVSKQWIGPEIPVTLVPDMEEMVFWKGFSEEQVRRRLAYAARTRTQHGKGTKRPAQGGVRVGSKRQRSTQKAITRDTDEHSDPDQVVGESESIEGFDAFNVASHVYASDSDNNDEGETNTPDDQLEQDQPAEPNIDEVLSEATVQDDIQDELFSNVESDADMETTGQDVVIAGVAQPDPPANPAADADAEDPQPRQPASRAVGVRGGHESRDVFELPDGSGTLRYYHASGSMQAFCCLGRSLHSSDCRKSATCCPVRRGSGRPIGLLVAWLQGGTGFDNKTEHVHSCRPSYEERKAAREWFMSLPHASEFCEFEKPKAPGDTDEPQRT